MPCWISPFSSSSLLPGYFIRVFKHLGPDLMIFSVSFRQWNHWLSWVSDNDGPENERHRQRGGDPRGFPSVWQGQCWKQGKNYVFTSMESVRMQGEKKQKQTKLGKLNNKPLFHIKWVSSDSWCNHFHIQTYFPIGLQGHLIVKRLRKITIGLFCFHLLNVTCVAHCSSALRLHDTSLLISKSPTLDLVL